eukprot:657050-Hanusia_phi.AAC.1
MFHQVLELLPSLLSPHAFFRNTTRPSRSSWRFEPAKLVKRRRRRRGGAGMRIRAGKKEDEDQGWGGGGTDRIASRGNVETGSNIIERSLSES